MAYVRKTETMIDDVLCKCRRMRSREIDNIGSFEVTQTNSNSDMYNELKKCVTEAIWRHNGSGAS